MIKIIPSVVAVLMVAGSAGAVRAEDKAPGVDAVCATTACRPGGYEVVIRVDDTSYRTVPVTASPYVLDDGELLIFPGETLAFSVVMADGQPGVATFEKRYAAHMPMQISVDDRLTVNPDDTALPAYVDGPDGDKTANLPPNTLLLSYGQMDKLPGMVLIIQHNLPGTLKLDAIMAIFGKEGYEMHPTSTCPIVTQLPSFEHWPHPIGPMLIENLHFLPAGKSATCD